jgi:hypothetical protein
MSRQTLRGALATICLIGTLTAWTAVPAHAQSETARTESAVASILKSTALDPTTYVPAILTYDSMTRDWNTSQPLFQQGFVEHNPRFTVNGMPDSTPLSYDNGRHQILMDSLTALEMSAAQNLTSRIVERALMEKYPQHRTLVKALGWAERIGVASLMSYQLSAPHYRQVGINVQMAAQLGGR